MSQTVDPVDDLLAKIFEEETITRSHRVILYDDNYHTFDEVIIQLMTACGYDWIRSEQLAMIVHTTGKANVFAGDFTECERVDRVLAQIQLTSEIEEI